MLTKNESLFKRILLFQLWILNGLLCILSKLPTNQDMYNNRFFAYVSLIEIHIFLEYQGEYACFSLVI